MAKKTMKKSATKKPTSKGKKTAASAAVKSPRRKSVATSAKPSRKASKPAGRSVIDKLISRLDTQSDHAADKVIALLVKMGRSTVPLLLQAATVDQSPRIRKWSLSALGAIGDARGIPLLMKSLNDDRMTVRLNAVRSLGRMKCQKAARPIALLLSDESGGIRVNALVALSEIGNRAVLPKIRASLKDPQWYVRQEAARTCGVLRDREAKAILMKLSTADDRQAVRAAAKTALASY